MNKYAIYTEKDVYPVLEKDGEYYIGAPGTGHFSGQWKFLGVVERLKNSRNIIKPEDALKITDWKFKNGSPKYQVVDLDHGTARRWASPRQVISFGPISDNMFSVATKTDNDEEIDLEESKELNETEYREIEFVINKFWDTKMSKDYEYLKNKKYNKKEDIKNDLIQFVHDNLWKADVMGTLSDHHLNSFISGIDTYITDYNVPRDEAEIYKLMKSEFINFLDSYKKQYSENKKYNIYATYGGDGVYNSKLVDTVDSEEQAVDRVAELQATGVGASYEEVEDDKKEESKTNNNLEDMLEKVFNGDNWYIDETDDKNSYLVVYCNPNYQSLCSEVDDWVEDPMFDKNKKYTIEDIEAIKKDTINEIKKHVKYYKGKFKVEEECSQASGVASGTNGKIDSFPINPKEMEKQRLKEDINNPYFVIEDIGAAYLMAGPFKTKAEAERKKKEQIKEYNLEDEAEIIHVWDWNTIKEFADNAYDTYQEFINAGDSAPYYKEEKLEESSEDKNIILNFINQCINSGKFNKEQINEIKYGFEDGLTLEQLKVYANPKFDNYQMYEIRWGFKDGLTLEQVRSYADSKISDSEMWNIREKLEGNYEKEDDSLFEALKELINYLNKNTKYNWDANEMYDNCAITESEDLGSYDYIEVFCWLDSKTQKVHYTINSKGNDTGTQYNSLEDVIKNLPILDRDIEDDLDESKDITKTLQEMALLEDYEEEYIRDYRYEVISYYDESFKGVEDTLNTNNVTEAGDFIWEKCNKGLYVIFKDKEIGNTRKFAHGSERNKETAIDIDDFLMESKEDNISPQKQKFIDYCKDKIEDLGDVEIYDEDYEENIQYHKLMHTEGIREFEDLYIVADFDNYENENLIAINNENKIVINTPMIDCNGYAGTMQFDKIDKKFYDQLMDYWDDIYMDEIIEE